MHMLPPKKRKENRRSQEEPVSSDEASSCTSESSPPLERTGSPSSISTSPARQDSQPITLFLKPFSQSEPKRAIVDSPPPPSRTESPPLKRKKIKDEPEELLEVDDLPKEIESRIEEIKTEDDYSGYSDEDIRLKIKQIDLDKQMHDQHQQHIELAKIGHMMVLHHQAQRVCRPLPLPLFPQPFFFPPVGFGPYPRILLPIPAIPLPIPPSSPPPLTPKRPYSPRLLQASPPRANTIQDGNNPSHRLTRIDDSYFSSEPGKRQKDEKLAAQLGLTSRDVERLISMPMDEFQDYCHTHNFTEEQMNLIRDIRRRGKNKVAAQNCRKRKIDQIDEGRGNVEDMLRDIEKNEKISSLLVEERDRWIDEFWKYHDLTEHHHETLGCSQHPIVTKACAMNKDCDISVIAKSIRSN